MSGIKDDERGLSLFDLEATLQQLMQMVSDPELTPEEREACEGELRKYVEQQVRKVDGIRNYLRHCEVMQQAAREEAGRQAERGRLWENRAKRLKDLCLTVMDFAGVKKLEGKTGSLSVRGNGGKRALTITAEMIPADMKRYSVSMTWLQWQAVMRALPMELLGELQPARMEPDTEAIRAALEQPCETCGGEKLLEHSITGGEVKCPSCGGSGKRGVPGARLEESGSHLRVE